MHAGRRRHGAKVTQRGGDPDGVVPSRVEGEERAELGAGHALEEGRGGPGERASVLSRLRGRRGSGEKSEVLVRGARRGAVPERSSRGGGGGGEHVVGRGASAVRAPGVSPEEGSSADPQYLDRLAGGSIEPAGQAKCDSQEGSQGHGVRVQRSNRGRRRRTGRAPKRGQRGGDPRHREAEPRWAGPQWAGPCQAGLYCAECGWELLPQAEGAVHSTVCEGELASRLRGGCPGTSAGAHPCSCTSLPQALPSESAALLVVEGAAALQALRCSTQAHRESGVALGSPLYNAVWNPEHGSVSRLLRCKACPASGPPVALAVEIHYPREPARDQIWLAPSAVRFCAKMWTLGLVQ
ncbi:uncharacterized protein LOC118210106 [Anguilla anguilla]|uniref:uncharacterized protein LOC118210106 n=1 Tax=Anguilla anguilla TaxID=7936 RepID=UPI0015AB5EBF|nr:uncharacterized protein LOC118210106 [Anguilla anguilla]